MLCNCLLLVEAGSIFKEYWHQFCRDSNWQRWDASQGFLVTLPPRPTRNFQFLDMDPNNRGYRNFILLHFVLRSINFICGHNFPKNETSQRPLLILNDFEKKIQNWNPAKKNYFLHQKISPCCIKTQTCVWVSSVMSCCGTAVTMLWHCCDAVVTQLWHCCDTVVTLLWHCCDTAVTLLWHCCDTVVTLSWHCCDTARCSVAA